MNQLSNVSVHVMPNDGQRKMFQPFFVSPEWIRYSLANWLALSAIAIILFNAFHRFLTSRPPFLAIRTLYLPSHLVYTMRYFNFISPSNVFRRRYRVRFKVIWIQPISRYFAAIYSFLIEYIMQWSEKVAKKENLIVLFAMHRFTLQQS